jgi:hypothetical protein
LYLSLSCRSWLIELVRAKMETGREAGTQRASRGPVAYAIDRVGEAPLKPRMGFAPI